MKRRAVWAAINDYPNPENRLHACLNNLTDWVAVLRDVFHFDEIMCLRDSEATPKNFEQAIEKLLRDTGPGDIAALGYSGHGTQVPDNNGDEADNYDEALYLYGADWDSSLFLDDRLRALVRKHQRPDGFLFVCLDSCFSGGMFRAVGFTPRCVPHPEWAKSPKPIRKRFGYPDYKINEVLISACNSHESCYEGSFNGRPDSAFGATVMPLLKANPNQIYDELWRSLRKLLPSHQYPQRPQLEGSRINKKRKLFS